MSDHLSPVPDVPADLPARPPGHLTYREATDATGVGIRHLRRLVAGGRLEAVTWGGRRWVTPAGLRAAGLTTNGPKPQVSGGGTVAGGSPGPAADDEVTVLRRRLAVAEALAEDRLRQLDRLDMLATRLTAALPSGDVASRPSRRRWRRRSA